MAPPTAGEKSEPVFNLFLFLSHADQIVTEIGAVRHDLAGPDARMLRHLQLAVADDLPGCRRFPVPDRYQLVDAAGGLAKGRLRWPTFVLLQEAGEHILVFEEVLAELGATQSPLCCITAVVDGTPRVDGVVTFGPAG